MRLLTDFTYTSVHNEPNRRLALGPTTALKLFSGSLAYSKCHWASLKNRARYGFLLFLVVQKHYHFIYWSLVYVDYALRPASSPRNWNGNWVHLAPYLNYSKERKKIPIQSLYLSNRSRRYGNEGGKHRILTTLMLFRVDKKHQGRSIGSQATRNIHLTNGLNNRYSLTYDVLSISHASNSINWYANTYPTLCHPAYITSKSSIRRALRGKRQQQKTS